VLCIGNDYFIVCLVVRESLAQTTTMKSMVTPLMRVSPFRHQNGHNTLPLFSLARYPSSPNFSFSPLSLSLSMAASSQSSSPVPLYCPSFMSFLPPNWTKLGLHASKFNLCITWLEFGFFCVCLIGWLNFCHISMIWSVCSLCDDHCSWICNNSVLLMV